MPGSMAEFGYMSISGADNFIGLRQGCFSDVSYLEWSEVPIPDIQIRQLQAWTRVDLQMCTGTGVHKQKSRIYE